LNIRRLYKVVIGFEFSASLILRQNFLQLCDWMMKPLARERMS